MLDFLENCTITHYRTGNAQVFTSSNSQHVVSLFVQTQGLNSLQINHTQSILCANKKMATTHMAVTSLNINHLQNSVDQYSRQDAQLSQRDRAAGCVIVFAKSRRLELGDNILQTV